MTGRLKARNVPSGLDPVLDRHPSSGIHDQQLLGSLAQLLAAATEPLGLERYRPAITVRLGIWRARIVAECGGLENRYWETNQGFKSLALRHSAAILAPRSV
jgi:hypothetical protein